MPGFARLDDADPCACGSGSSFGDCCARALRGTPPVTAEGLMRSRYTAFVVGDAHHLRETWHPGTRPEDVVLDPATEWRGLDIVDTLDGMPGDRRGWVEFHARHRDGTEDGVLHERSRFVWQSGRWWYLDGAVR